MRARSSAAAGLGSRSHGNFHQKIAHKHYPFRQGRNMKMAENGFWSYLDKWRKITDGQEPLEWLGTWLKNSWCGKCRFCCGPQDSPEPFPMALLPAQLRPDLDQDFYLLDHDMAYIGAKGCKACTDKGCRLKRAEKPVACGLFPIVLANGRLYLYQTCPAVIFLPLAHFCSLAKDVAAMLDKFSFDELRHISIDLPQHVLASKYIDLHIRIFDSNGKNILFD